MGDRPKNANLLKYLLSRAIAGDDDGVERILNKLEPRLEDTERLRKAWKKAKDDDGESLAEVVYDCIEEEEAVTVEGSEEDAPSDSDTRG